MRLTNEAEAVKSASASEMSCGVQGDEVCDSWNEADKWHYDPQWAYPSDGYDSLS